MSTHKIAVFGVPRSGTSWLSQIFNSHPSVALRYQPLFSYGHKGRLSENSSDKQISLFFEEILNSQDDYALMQTESQRGTPHFSKELTPTHVIFKETRYLHIIENILMQSDDVKVVGIIRNPLSAMASWIKAPKEFHSDWKILDEWRMAPSKNKGRIEEYFGFEKWKQAASDFQKFEEKYPGKFYLLRYEDLRAEPQKCVEDLFRFCELSMNSHVADFILNSQSRHDSNPYSVYRSQMTGDSWRDILPQDVSNCIVSELQNTPLSTYLD